MNKTFRVQKQIRGEKIDPRYKGFRQRVNILHLVVVAQGLSFHDAKALARTEKELNIVLENKHE